MHAASMRWVRLALSVRAARSSVVLAVAALAVRRRAAAARGAAGALALAPLAAGLLCAGVLAAPARAGGCTVSPSPDWKNVIDFPDDPFRADGGAFGEPGWVKFTILTCDPGTVYFQDSVDFAFHYDFCTSELDPLVGLTLQQFNDVTLHAAGQEAILGAVVMPPLPVGAEAPIQEYGIQLVRHDPYDPQEVVDLLATINAAIDAAPGTQPFYFPTFEQQESALANEAFLNANGVLLGSTAQWISGNALYSRGWALGRLNFVTAGDIVDEFTGGTLLSSDILLTDAVPSDIPLLAGVLSLAPATPSSHVAILADTFDVPFAYLADEADAARALELDGRLVVLRASEMPFAGADVRLVDVEDELTPQQIDEILALKAPAPLDIDPVTPFGALSENTDVLVQDDIRFFGGKASNYGILRRSIPDRSPKALGISFELWEAFLGQTIAGGGTLRDHVDSVLGGQTFPPQDMALLSAQLEAIRDVIRDEGETAFTPAQEAAVIAVLEDPQYGFDSMLNIRFRSSTNLEDAEQFTGAGLYDSFSGCLDDDLDPAQQTTSHCDPTEDSDRGVFRAIRRVFASFYNDNAVLERLRFGVDEHDVGMGLLVHHSFPDELELANGVATLTRDPPFNQTVRLVTQLGAVSVANPEGGAIPEQVDVTIFTPSSMSLSLTTSSSLVQLGDTVMTWETDYRELVGYLLDAADQFALESGKTRFVLDYEYKQVEPGGGALPAGGLVVKQVREIPQPDTTPSITPFLVNEPFRWTPLQGGGVGDVFAVHRAKVAWDLTTRNTWLDAPGLAAGTLFDDVRLALHGGCAREVVSGPLAAFPSHAHSLFGSKTTDSWELPDLDLPRAMSLEVTGVGLLVAPADIPVLTLRDLGAVNSGQFTVTSSYDTPVTSVGFLDELSTKTSESVPLVPVALDTAGHAVQERVFAGPLGATIETTFTWAPIVGFCAGCIQPLSSWVETRIEGLTSEPIVLTSNLAQSYDAGQHNFVEWFVFEPRLDPGVTQQQLHELDQLGIHQIFAVGGPLGTNTVQYLTKDGCSAIHVPAEPRHARPNALPEPGAPVEHGSPGSGGAVSVGG